MERLSILQEVEYNIGAPIASCSSAAERILKGNLGPLCGLNGKWQSLCATPGHNICPFELQSILASLALLRRPPQTTLSYARGEDHPFMNPRSIDFIYPQITFLRCNVPMKRLKCISQCYCVLSDLQWSPPAEDEMPFWGRAESECDRRKFSCNKSEKHLKNATNMHLIDI